MSVQYFAFSGKTYDNGAMQTIFQNPLLVGFIALCITNVIFLGIILWMYFRQRKFLVGFDSENVSQSLQFVSANLRDMEKFRKEMETYLTQVERRLRKSVQSVNTVRFNPFKGTGDGGNQSFATALLNEDGDGVVISSLHSRDHTRVFSKPVVGRESEIELSEEERDAIAMR